LSTFIAIIIVAVAIVFVSVSFKVLYPHQGGVVVRLGKYSRTIGPGFNTIIPFIETIHRVDIWEKVVDIVPQEVITRDNVIVTMDAVVYYEVTDPFKLLFSIQNFTEAVTKLSQTTLRNLIDKLILTKH
jgi:regulator of protease activity HflC (stomatin/prohibitin superfamily)